MEENKNPNKATEKENGSLDDENKTIEIHANLFDSGTLVAGAIVAALGFVIGSSFGHKKMHSSLNRIERNQYTSYRDTMNGLNVVDDDIEDMKNLFNTLNPIDDD